LFFSFKHQLIFKTNNKAISKFEIAFIGHLNAGLIFRSLTCWNLLDIIRFINIQIWFCSYIVYFQLNKCYYLRTFQLRVLGRCSYINTRIMNNCAPLVDSTHWYLACYISSLKYSCLIYSIWRCNFFHKLFRFLFFVVKVNDNLASTNFNDCSWFSLQR